MIFCKRIIVFVFLFASHLLRAEPFNEVWLSDFPYVLEHLNNEHVLHVKSVDDKGQGIHWHESKFGVSTLDSSFMPESRFQERLAYYLIPESSLNFHKTLSHSSKINESLKVERSGEIYWKFYIHPSSEDAFSSLGSKFDYVPAAESDLIGSPTASYRSWVVRSIIPCTLVPQEGSIPFVFKMGVPGQSVGAGRWIGNKEMKRSIGVQAYIEQHNLFNNNNLNGLTFFSESFGFTLKQNEAEKLLKSISGVIIREFPHFVLENKYQAVSLASLMSVESGISILHRILLKHRNNSENFSSKEYLKAIFIDLYISSLAPLIDRGLFLEPHSQNLLVVLDEQEDIVGFCYRDLGGASVFAPDISLDLFPPKGGEINVVTSFSWFYRYQCFEKILNTITRAVDSGFFPIEEFEPYQIGHTGKIRERSVADYLIDQKIGADLNLESVFINEKDRTDLILDADKEYKDKVNQSPYGKYLKRLKKKNILPSAEYGSEMFFEEMKSSVEEPKDSL
jgi:hypothetical protein